MKSFSSVEVAETLISRARRRGIAISNLKLQKLIFYAQAWNLVFTRKSLLDESFEAWVHGPVLPSIFRRFKVYRWNDITCPVVEVADPELRNHLDMILDAYGGLTAQQLERLTHEDRPWRDARLGLSPDEPSNEIITKKSIRAFYTTVFDEEAKSTR